MSPVAYYPVRISPSKAVWEVDWWIRTKLGLRTIRPPIEYRWRKASGRRNNAKKQVVKGPKDARTAPITKWRTERAEEALGQAIAADPAEEAARRGPDKSKFKTKRPEAIVPCYVYPGFTGWDDYHALKRLSDAIGLGIQGLPQAFNPETQSYEYFPLKCEHIRFLEEANEGAARAKTRIHKSIKPGEKVKIAGEGWVGFEGEFVSSDGITAEVLIQIFGELRIVPVSASRVKPA